MEIIDKTIDQIIPVVMADNSETAIRDYLKTALRKVYDEGYYRGTLNIIKAEYPELKLFKEVEDV
jgi:hypothetical protein